MHIYQPPYSLSVSTNVGAKCLRLVSKHFGKDHHYKNIFNKNNVKSSYCAVDQNKIINWDNRKLVDNRKQQHLKCNCRVPNICPVEGKCQSKKFIYMATVTSNNIEKHYVGSTSRNFKRRYYKLKIYFL